jgi:hypothetical protein
LDFDLIVVLKVRTFFFFFEGWTRVLLIALFILKPCSSRKGDKSIVTSVFVSGDEDLSSFL